jgi:hypothetical protein
MDFRCPSCQKDLTVPDEYAGQLMKCPLCQNTFQAPALPPPVAPSAPPPDPVPNTVESPPPAPPPEAQRKTKEKEAPTAPPPPVPTGDYTHTRTIWISPRVVPWLAPAALLIAFLLTFFSWAYAAGTAVDHIAWGWGWWPEWNVLTLLYTLVLLAALFVSAAITVLRLIPNFKVPAGLEQIWPWRAGLAALFALLGLFFLGMQLVVGFVPKDPDLLPVLHTTPFVWLALLFQIIGTVGALLDFWLEVRGTGRPMPRIDISW